RKIFLPFQPGVCGTYFHSIGEFQGMSPSEMSGKLALFPELLSQAGEPTRAEGMLPSQDIKELIANGSIRAIPEIGQHQIQPASLDLRLGDVGYRVRASFLPQHRSVEHGITEAGLVMGRVDLTRTTVFEKSCVYIVPLVEELHLPGDISARANPKSSTG